ETDRRAHSLRLELFRPRLLELVGHRAKRVPENGELAGGGRSVISIRGQRIASADRRRPSHQLVNRRRELTRNPSRPTNTEEREHTDEDDGEPRKHAEYLP